MLIYASKHGETIRSVSFAVYGISLTLLYLASTLYHSVTSEKLKLFFRKMDHLSIFLLIAGTYTPMCLLGIKGVWGWTIFGIIWGLSIVGIIYELLFLGKYKWITVSIYLAMGWLCIVAIKPMIDNIPYELLLWILAGGVFYTGGVVFYVKKSMRYHHVIWHLFVLAGSVMHFVGLFKYLV